MIERLGHVGIHVTDLDTSKSFYRDLVGLTVTDGSPEMGMVFMSSRPTIEHHELLLCGGRTAPPGTNLIQQISFFCNDLDAVKEIYRRLVSARVEIQMTASHGNAIGVYFYDPDHNVCEVYCQTGFVARQPFLMAVDMDKSNDEILAE